MSAPDPKSRHQSHRNGDVRFTVKADLERGTVCNYTLRSGVMPLLIPLSSIVSS
jgi:hypothetical protein